MQRAAVSQTQTRPARRSNRLSRPGGLVRPDADPEINAKFRVEWLRRREQAMRREREHMTPPTPPSLPPTPAPPPPAAVSLRSALSGRGPARDPRRLSAGVRFAEVAEVDDYEPPELTSDDRAWIAEMQAWRREQEEARRNAD